MPGRQRRQQLDDLDRALLAALSRDGRASNVELAASLGASEKTVRLRIARLVAEHGLAFTAELPEPPDRSRMVYLLHTETGRRNQVAEFLATRHEVRRVHLITGAADVLVSASFPDDAAALRFAAQVLGGHPGVRSAEPHHVIREVGAPAPGNLAGSPDVDTDALAALMIGPPRYANIDELTEAVCDAAVTGLGADRALITTTRPGERPRDGMVAKRRGLSDEYIDGLVQRLRDGRTDGVIKRVWDTRLHVRLTDARTDPLMASAHDLVRAEGYVSLLTLPMLCGDSLLATLSLYYDRLTTLDDHYVGTAQGVADHFAVAVARVTGLAPAVPGSPAEGATT